MVTRALETGNEMKLFRCTSADKAREIMKAGFVDATGNYLTDRVWKGVWLADRPLDVNDGAAGDTVVEVDLNLTDEELDNWEWKGETKSFREFLISAELVNSRVVSKRIMDEE
jgi:hypothetical protein